MPQLGLRPEFFFPFLDMADGSQPITIVGAGLVGALLATVLARRGYRVTVYERYGDIRAIPSSGRSINLVATARGLRALTLLPDDVRARLLELGVRVTGRVIHAGGEPIFQRYGKDDSEFNYSISRYELNKFLISEAEAAGATLRFGHRLLGVELEGEYPVLTFAAPHEASGQRGVLDSALHAEDNTGAEREARHFRDTAPRVRGATALRTRPDPCRPLLPDTRWSCGAAGRWWPRTAAAPQCARR